MECESKSEIIDIPIEVDKLDMTALKELPVGVIEEDIIDAGSEKKQKDRLDSDIRVMTELPVGVLDEDIATSEFSKDDDETNISKGELQAENEEFIEEFPVGLLDEDTEKSEVLPAEGEECNANDRTVSSADDAAKETQLEQPLVEEQEEVQSSGESDGWIKIEFQKDDQLKGDEQLDIEDSGEGIANDTMLPSVITQVTGHDRGNGEVCLKANDVANILPESMEFEKKPEEKLTQQETQVDGYDIIAGQAISADHKDTQTLAKEGAEQSADLAVVEHDADMKLLEENEKLRKLMEELLEASKRSKRVRTKRFRPVTSDMSSKSSE